MFTLQGLEFRYALHPLPPGRLPFRRQRFELWHGATLIAAGWRVSERDAARALVGHASSYGHRLFGLSAPARPEAVPVPELRRGAVCRLVLGSVTCQLVPRALEVPAAPVAPRR